MAISNLPSTEQLTNQIPVQTAMNIGRSALSSENHGDAESQSFQVKTSTELLQSAITSFDSLNDFKELSYSEQPRFTHTVHDVLNKHFQNQHKSEWARGIDHAIAPPLPHQWVGSRINTYYGMVHKGDGDKAHENTIKALRKQHLHYAVDMARSLPEISTAMDIQAILDDSGHEIAADAVGDLLVVYGVTIYYIRDKQIKLRKLEKEKADRAARSLDRA